MRGDGGQAQAQGQPEYETYDCEQLGISAMSAHGAAGASKRPVLAAKRKPKKTKRLPNQQQRSSSFAPAHCPTGAILLQQRAALANFDKPFQSNDSSCLVEAGDP